MAAGRLEKNLKAYIGNAVSNRQLEALGEHNVVELLKLCTPALSDAHRKRVTDLCQTAKKKIEAKDNGSKAAFSAVNQVYGTNAPFFAASSQCRPPTKPSKSGTGGSKKKGSSSSSSKKRKAPPTNDGAKVAKSMPGNFSFAQQARSYDAASTKTMEGDDARMAFYRGALHHVAEGKVVLDIGTGDHGILAQLALEAGASFVYAVEIREGAAKSAQKELDTKYPGQAKVFKADLSQLERRDKELLDALQKVEVVVRAIDAAAFCPICALSCLGVSHCVGARSLWHDCE